MRTFWRILCVFFGLGAFGSLTKGRFFFMGFLLALLFGYLGWRDQGTTKDKEETKKGEDENISA